MAYAFKAVDELLDPSQQKQNIFASDPTQQGAPGMPQDQGVKTSTEGQVSQESGTSNVTPTKQASVQSSDTGQADKAAIKANSGKITQPQAVTNVQSQLQAKQQNLQAEADKYVQQGRDQQNYNVSTENTEKAIKGDADQQQALRTLLDRKNVNQAEEFKPSDVSVADADLINTEAGLRKLVGKGQGPQYTQGMAAFDAQSLRRAPEFSNLMKMIQGQQNDLRKTAQDYAGSKRKEVEDFGAQQLTAAQKQARDYLGSQAGSIDEMNAQEAAAYNASLDRMRQDGLGRANYNALDEARIALSNRLRGTDPNLANLAASAKVDPAQFARIRDNASANDFVSSDEAQRFNSIMGLLGQGGSTRSESMPLGANYSYDQDALQNALLEQVQGTKQQKDTRSKSQIEQIMAEANKSAEQGNLDRGYFASKAAEQEANRIAKEAGLDGVAGNVNFENFTQYGDRLAGNNALNQQQVNKLNNLYKNMGDQTRIQYQDPGQAYNFNKNDYIKALQDAQLAEEQRRQNPPDRSIPGIDNSSIGGAFSDLAKQGISTLGTAPGAIASDIGKTLSEKQKSAFKKLGLRG